MWAPFKSAADGVRSEQTKCRINPIWNCRDLQATCPGSGLGNLQAVEVLTGWILDTIARQGIPDSSSNMEYYA